MERELIVRKLCLLVLAVLVVHAATAYSQPSAPSQTFLIASDLHFNPFADPSLVPALAAASSNRWEGILNRSKLPAYSPYGQDANWWLLHSALDAMRAAEPHPAVVMITGDFLAHGFPQTYAKLTHDPDREHYRAFVRKTVEFIGGELRQRFKQSQILITPGNNDNECGDYDIEAGGPFLSDTAELARKLAHGEDRFTADWKALGSYSLQPRRIPGVRILAVNSVFFSNRYQAANFANGCAKVDSTAATRTFAWLESNLSQAAQAHQKVWLMFHIPPGIDGFSSMMRYWSLAKAAAAGSEDLCSNAIVPMWKPESTAQLERLMAEYQTTITASFAGHDHTDDFRVIHGGETGAQFVLIDPPISPIYGQNPAFRIVTFSSDGRLGGQSTYYLTNLASARSDGQASVPGIWTKEYTFAEEWQTPQLDAASLNAIYQRIASDPKARAQWLTLLNVSSAHDPVPSIGVKALDCAIAALDPASYQACACPAAEH
jgi:sphingomyelin phosphodiesterase acid-like 3